MGFGKRLEEVAAGRDAKLAAFRASLEPLRSMLTYQPFIGGQSPLFVDYIVVRRPPMGKNYNGLSAARYG